MIPEDVINPPQMLRDIPAVGPENHPFKLFAGMGVIKGQGSLGLGVFGKASQGIDWQRDSGQHEQAGFKKGAPGMAVVQMLGQQDIGH